MQQCGELRMSLRRNLGYPYYLGSKIGSIYYNVIHSHILENTTCIEPKIGPGMVIEPLTLGKGAS